MRFYRKKEHYNGVIDILSKIYEKNGITGLYSGLAGTILGTASANFAYFYWYGLIRTQYTVFHKRRYGHTQFSTATELALGAVAGALGQLFTIPISVVTTRQQISSKSESLVDVAKQVAEKDGISGFWRGLKASLVLVINPSITYGSYERLKSIIFPGRNHLFPRENFLLGALSKAMATIVTQPLIVAKVMQQNGGSATTKDGKKVQFNSFLNALLYLAKNEGLKGLFKGLGPQISKGVLVQGFLFMFKDQIELFIVLLLKSLQKNKRRTALRA